MNSPAPASAATVAMNSTQQWQKRPRFVAPSPLCLALCRHAVFDSVSSQQGKGNHESAGGAVLSQAQQTAAVATASMQLVARRMQALLWLLLTLQAGGSCKTLTRRPIRGR
jgi:hypothetical protein